MKLLPVIMVGLAYAISVTFIVLLARFVLRAVYIYLRKRWAGNLASIAEIKTRYPAGVRFYLVSDIWIFNAFAFPNASGAEWMSPPEIIANGIMIKKVRVTRQFLKREFPKAKITECSLACFD